jgi:hypothetical protein
MSNRELGLVREALSAAGMDLTYAYEDLVFLEHTGFLLQFTENEKELLIHRNREAVADELVGAITLLQEKAKEVGLTFNQGRYYRLTHGKDRENIQLEFC